jgi:hypothetical protein
MKVKRSSLLIYSKASILNYIPNTNAVYYLRGIADENSLYPIYYIGRAKRGQLKRILLNEFYKNNWKDIVYINFIECGNDREAKALQKYEVLRHKPKYNFYFA